MWLVKRCKDNLIATKKMRARSSSTTRMVDCYPFSPALSVYIVWHPDCTEGSFLAESLFEELCAVPSFPAIRGLGMPIRFRSSASPDTVPIPIPFGEANQSGVIVLVDSHLATSCLWREYTDRLVAEKDRRDCVIPVALTDVANLPPKLGEFNAIELFRLQPNEQKEKLAREVMHELSRLLDPDVKKIKVFLSHAKQDGLGITDAIRRYLHEEARLDDFLDAADIPYGVRFSEFIKENVASASALLAIQTDDYASREWCRLEILEAKKSHVPIAVLSAVEQGEVRSFPYMGNVPVVRWHGEQSLAPIVRALLREILRCKYFPRKVEYMCKQDTLGLAHPYPPELLTALINRTDIVNAKGLYLYPDPPLGTEELEILAQLDFEIIPVTPTTMVVK